MVSTSTVSSQGARLCIFDLDGTLADTAPDLFGALNYVLETENMQPVAHDEARGFLGHGARVLLQRAHVAQGVAFGEPYASDLVARFIKHYGKHIADGSLLFPGALDAMDELERAGWRFAVCTNKPEKLAQQLLGELGVTQRFDAITGGDSFAYRKPDGRHIRSTADLAGFATDAVIMVGDSGPDIDAARDAGVPVVAVSFGYHTAPVNDLNPDAVIDHFAELPTIAERLLPAKAA